MTENELELLLKSQLNTIAAEYKAGPPVWKKLPNSSCVVGYNGSNSLLRIPIKNATSTGWKALNAMIRKRVSQGPPSYINLEFDISNVDRLAPFLFELVDTVDSSDLDPSKILDDLLRTWARLWGNASVIFDKEDQIGALGELLVLERALEASPSLATLNSWKAPEGVDDLHDFEAEKGFLEIKTSSVVPRRFYVTSLDQMDHKETHPKSLAVIFVKLVQGTDFTLPDVVERIRRRCSELGISVPFDELLRKRGYRDSEAEEYSQASFDLDGIDFHKVSDNTPIYTTRNLDSVYPAVVGIRQTVDPTLIDFSEIETDGWNDIFTEIGL